MDDGTLEVLACRCGLYLVYGRYGQVGGLLGTRRRRNDMQAGVMVRGGWGERRRG